MIKVGIIGIGSIGRSYVSQLESGKLNGISLTAVCVTREEQIEWMRKHASSDICCFLSLEQFFHKADIDAVIIATPHYSHPEIAIQAFEKGLHVLIEKPAGVFTENVKEMNRAAKKSGKVFAIMYNQRMKPIYQKIRELIQSGELGEIRRTNWIATGWYRPQSYYDSSKWRGTWGGEGGGVLLNQASHQLDLWQWTTGLMPKRVRAFMSYGKYHDIDVEDDVTAYVDYANGATGVFITSTGEAPGTDRFEITGDRGKIVMENGKLLFYRLTQSERAFNASCTAGFGSPECWEIDIPITGKDPGHMGIVHNWADAILQGTPLISPGEEGIKGLEISNAMHLSSWLDQTIELPIDEKLYYKMLQEKVKQSN